MMRRVFICRGGDLCEDQVCRVRSSLSADNVDISELTLEQVEAMTFQDGDVAICSPFYGDLFQSLLHTPQLRVYGPHAVAGPFETLPEAQRVFAQTLQPLDESRPLRVAIVLNDSESLTQFCQDRLEWMGAAVVQDLDEADIIIANKQTSSTLRATAIVVSSLWVNMCFEKFKASDGVEYESERDYRLDSKPLQGFRVATMMTSVSMFNLFARSIEALGAELVDSTEAPGCNYVLVNPQTIVEYIDEIRKAHALGITILDQKWALSCRGANDYVDPDPFVIEPEQWQDIEHVPPHAASCTTLQHLESESTKQKLHACTQATPTATTTASVGACPDHVATPCRQFKHRDTSIKASPVQVARRVDDATPASPQDAVKQKACKRKVKVSELCNCERNFQKILGYLHMCRGNLASRELLTNPMLISQFENFRKLKDVSRDIIKSLEESLSTWTDDSVVGHVFNPAIMTKISNLYRKVLTALESSIAVWEDKMRTSKKFAAHVHELEQRPDARRQTLLELLRVPMQHVMRYNLHLREIAKSTPEGHPDAELIPALESEFKNMLLDTEKMQDATEKWEALARLRNAIEGLPAGVISGRTEGQDAMIEVEILDTLSADDEEGRKLELYLLTNKVLVVSAKSRRAANTWRAGRKPFVFVDHFSLSLANIYAAREGCDQDATLCLAEKTQHKNRTKAESESESDTDGETKKDHDFEDDSVDNKMMHVLAFSRQERDTFLAAVRHAKRALHCDLTQEMLEDEVQLTEEKENFEPEVPLRRMSLGTSQGSAASNPQLARSMRSQSDAFLASPSLKRKNRLSTLFSTPTAATSQSSQRRSSNMFKRTMSKVSKAIKSISRSGSRASRSQQRSRKDREMASSAVFMEDDESPAFPSSPLSQMNTAQLRPVAKRPHLISFRASSLIKEESEI